MNLVERIAALEKRVDELERQLGIQSPRGIRPRFSRYPLLSHAGSVQAIKPVGEMETKDTKPSKLEELKRMLAEDEEDNQKVETQEETLKRLGLKLPTHNKD